MMLFSSKFELNGRAGTDKLMNMKYSRDVTSQNGIDTEVSGAAELDTKGLSINT